MIFWFTGQPGHGKTLHAIDKAIEFRDTGRLVFVGNVAGFDYAKAKMQRITPEQFKNWMEFLPDGAVCLIDEAYEHGMLPKRPPGAKVPAHVEQLAKHRHRGLDFIFVSQSPARQVDDFVHDLIERHVHVRRRFGMPYVHLRIFDRFERNPTKGFPLTVKRTRLPKRPMGLYMSTVMDTTEKNIPWYYPVFGALLVFVVIGAYVMMGNVEESLHGQEIATEPAGDTGESGGVNGAIAKVAPTLDQGPTSRELRSTDYVAWLTPRVPGQPWTAPAYDGLSTPPRPPRVFCMIGGEANSRDATCSCLTEQGTRYLMDLDQCATVALVGQYEPFLDDAQGDVRRMDDVAQLRRLGEERLRQEPRWEAGSVVSLAGSTVHAPETVPESAP